MSIPVKQAFQFRNIVATFYVLLLFAFLVFYFSNFQSTYIDDAFIQLQYAKTLSNNQEWGFYAGYPCNTATSPLNVILTAFFVLFTGDALIASIWFTALQFLLMFLILQAICTNLFGSGFLAVFPFVAILTNPLLLSTLGMETTLFGTLLLISLWLYLGKRWNVLAFTAGLLTLARFDGFLFFVCLLVAVPEKRLKFLLIYSATLLPWHLYSWIYLGSFFPDTLIIKTRQRVWAAGISFFQGLRYYYFPRFPLATSWSMILMPFALLSFRSPSAGVKKAIALLMSFALLHFVAYSLLGVPPYHWYYGPLAFCGTVAGSFGILSLLAGMKYPRIATVLPAIAIAIAILMLFKNEGFPLKEAPIHTNGGTHERYKQIALSIRDQTPADARFALMGEIGTMGYYLERVILSNFTSNVYIDNARKQHRYMKSPVLRTFMEWNFYWRKNSGTLGRRSYLLRHVAYAHTPRKDPRILRMWDTSTKWFPAGRLYLERIGKKPR